MTPCNENKFSPNTEDKYETELEELAKEFITLPDKMATIKDSNHDQETSFGTIEGIKLATNDPSTPTSFPTAPQFCSGMSGEHLQLVRSGNTKMKILMTIASISIVCSIAFRALTLSLYYDKKADNSDLDSPNCDSLVNRLEISLKVITDLGEALASLTKMPQFSTISLDKTVDMSWAVSSKYKWN